MSNFNGTNQRPLATERGNSGTGGAWLAVTERKKCCDRSFNLVTATGWVSDYWYRPERTLWHSVARAWSSERISEVPVKVEPCSPLFAYQ
jgi:hypothetical protein